MCTCTWLQLRICMHVAKDGGGNYHPQPSCSNRRVVEVATHLEEQVRFIYEQIFTRALTFIANQSARIDVQAVRVRLTVRNWTMILDQWKHTVDRLEG